MERPRTKPSTNSGANSAAGRHAARTGTGASSGHTASGAPRTSASAPRRASSGTGGARSTSSGTRRTAGGASGANRQRATGARTPARGGSSARRMAPPRKPGRRRASRLSLKERRLLLIGGAAVIVIVAVILALTLPSGKRDDARQPQGSPDAQVDTLENESTDAAAQQEPAAEGEASDAGAEAGSNSTDGAPKIAFSDAFTNLTTSQAELVEKYHAFSDIPQTEQPLGLSECARVDDSYFDDAIFVGDSVTLKLRQYVLQERKGDSPNLLGKATFLAAQSFGARNALREISENSIHPVIGGVKMTLEDAIALSGAKKCYIMLGMNDVGVSGIDKAVSYMGQLLQRIQEKNPGIVIFVESATPRLSGSHPTTNQLFAYDIELYDALQRLGDPNIHFVDVAYVMRDETGKLYPDYCSDKDGMALHFTNSGCREWIDYLYTHALT